MRYTVYEEKMKRILAFLISLKRHAAIIAVAMILVFGAAAGVLSVKGIFIERISASDFMYGETPELSARALFSKVRYTFGAVGTKDFSGELPTVPGKYTVRATANGVFRKNVSETSVSMNRRPLAVEASGMLNFRWEEEEFLSVVHADGLAEGDTILSALPDCSISEAGTQIVTVDKESIRIVNAEGEDVTACYEITVVPGEVTISRILLKAASDSLEKTWDNTPTAFDEWEIVSGNLLAGHRAEAVFDSPYTGTGRFTNSFTLMIFEGEENVTDMYEILYDFGTLTVNPIKLTLTSQSAEKVYDGSALSCKQYELTYGTLLKGHRLEVEFYNVITDAGSISNTFAATVWDENGNEVTYGYEIVCNSGMLKVTPRELVLQSGSDQKQYDGKPLVCDQWNIVSGSVVVGETLSVTTTGTITDPGSVPNTFEVDVKRDNQSVKNNYIIKKTEGTLTVTGEKPKDPDSPVFPPIPDGGTSLADRPISQNNSVALYVYAPFSGRLYLRYKSYGDYNGRGFDKAKVFPASYFKISPLNYTGSVLRAGRYLASIIRIRLASSIGYVTPDYTWEVLGAEGGDVSWESDKTQYDVQCYLYDGFGGIGALESVNGYSAAYLEYKNFVNSNYTMVPADLQDVLRKYVEDVGLKSGESIEKIAQCIRRAGKYNMNFEPYPQDTDIVAYFLTKSKEGICQHFAAAGVMIFRYLGYPARYTVGYLASTEENAWVSVANSREHAWVEVFIENGWIHVDVTPPSDDSSKDDGSGGNGGNGDDGGGNDDFNYDDLENALIIKTASASKEYDGTPLTCDFWWLSSGKLKEGHRLEVSVSGMQTDVGKTPAEASYRVLDDQGNDVTDEYLVTVYCGTLEVKKRRLVITTSSAQKIADGKPLCSPYFWISEGSLLSGHYIDLTVAGKQVGVGESENYIAGTVDIYMVDSFNNNVSVLQFYDVEIRRGTLRVDPA